MRVASKPTDGVVAGLSPPKTCKQGADPSCAIWRCGHHRVATQLVTLLGWFRTKLGLNTRAQPPNNHRKPTITTQLGDAAVGGCTPSATTHGQPKAVNS